MPDPANRAADRAGVIAPPPLIFAGFFALGWAVERFAPLGLPPGPPWTATGIALIVAGAAIGLWVLVLFRRAHTAVEPWKPTTALVTDGPFRFSRNPIYVALALCHAGGAIALEWSWALIAVLPALAAVHFGVVRREERYLSAKFGAPYRAYCAIVRRWL